MKDITQIYSIVYSQGQPCEYTCYNNENIRTVEQKSYLFEYSPMIDILDNKWDSDLKDKQYLGIFSWKFSLKTGIFRKKLYWILEKYPNFDVYIFCRPLKYPYIVFTEHVHPGFKVRFNMLLQKIGKGQFVDKEPTHTVYSNFFIAKKELYKQFVEEWIKPSIEVMETDEELKQLVWQECNYNGLPKEQLKQFTGLDHYTFHTFLLERLFSFYLEENKQLRICKF